MTNLSQAYANTPIGGIVQAPYGVSDPRFLLCDGRKIDRAAYPLFSALSPIGTFTTTYRNGRVITPAFAGLTADGTNFVACGGTSSNTVQTSPDGITWTSRTVTGVDPINLGWDGTNMVAVGSAGAYYSTNNGVTWVASTGGAASGQFGSLAYASSIGANGRWLMHTAGTIYKSDNRGVAWSAGTNCPSTAYGMCWTGAKFIATGNLVGMYTNVDGSSAWSTINPYFRGAFQRIVSDGNGKVAAWDASYGLLHYSLDHGVTWNYRAFGSQSPSSAAGKPGRLGITGSISFTNGRFFLTLGAASPADTFEQNFFCSTDLLTWVPLLDVATPYSGSVNMNSVHIVYKSGVYWMNDTYTALSGATMVEDLTKIYLPNGFQGASGGAEPTSYNNYQPYIRVK